MSSFIGNHSETVTGRFGSYHKNDAIQRKTEYIFGFYVKFSREIHL